MGVLLLCDVSGQQLYAVVEFFDLVIDLDDVVLSEKVIFGGQFFIDFYDLGGVVSMHQQKKRLFQFDTIVYFLGYLDFLKIFDQVFTSFHLIIDDHVGILGIVPMCCELIAIFYVSNCSVQIDVHEHHLFLTKILLLDVWIIFLHILSTTLSLYFRLLFKDNHSIGVILYSLVITRKHELGVGFAKVVFDHVIVTEL